jgi:hypothetical protein
MLKVKDTLRATVYLGFDGRVFKNYLGPDAEKRFDNEVTVLRHLEARGCPFVPKLLAADRSKLQIITTNCGSRVQHLDEARTKELFAELEPFGVRHDDGHAKRHLPTLGWSLLPDRLRVRHHPSRRQIRMLTWTNLTANPPPDH